MVVVLAFLTILGGYYWKMAKYSNYLVVVFLLLTELVSIDMGESPIKSLDFFLLLMVYSIVSSKVRISKLFSVTKDRVGRIVLLMFFFLTLSFVVTVVFGIESLSYSFKVYRTFGYFLFYFVLRSIPKSELVKAFRVIVYISFVWGCLFLLQLFGIHLLKGATEIDSATGQISRLRNIPTTSVLVITTVVLSNINSKLKIGLILFWSGILVLSQHRGVMLSLLVAIPLLMVLRHQFRKIMVLGIGFCLVLIAFAPMIANRFSSESNDNGMSTFEEIKYGLTMKGNSYYTAGSGTFIFRLFLIRERVEYMVKEPIRLIVGNGMMHEDSPATQHKFNFQMGTYKYGSGSPVMQQISTSDVGLLTFFFRFGLIFMILLVMLFKRMIGHFLANANMGSDILFVLSTYCFLRIFSGEEFTMLMFLQIFGCYVYSTKCKTQKNIRKN